MPGGATDIAQHLLSHGFSTVFPRLGDRNKKTWGKHTQDFLVENRIHRTIVGFYLYILLKSLWQSITIGKSIPLVLWIRKMGGMM